MMNVSTPELWMMHVDDKTSLAKISIPGTHGSWATIGASEQIRPIDKFIATQINN